MVESIFGYLALLAIFTTLVEIANYLNTRRVRLPAFKSRSASRSFLGLNVSSVPVSLAEIRRQEYEAQLDEVVREIEKVSLLIETYCSWGVPAKEVECCFARKERLLARYEWLVNGDSCVAEPLQVIEEPAVVVPMRIRTPKALPPVRGIIMVRARRRTSSSNNIS